MKKKKIDWGVVFYVSLCVINCDDGEVVAWQPLPQPYKAEMEGEG